MPARKTPAAKTAPTPRPGTPRPKAAAAAAGAAVPAAGAVVLPAPAPVQAPRPAKTDKLVKVEKVEKVGKADKADKVEKTPKTEKAEKTAKPPKPPKPPKLRPVLVRDGFTMPEADFALIATLKARALAGQRETKKSELLRAGLHALAAMDAATLMAALKALEPVKIGRPKKGH